MIFVRITTQCCQLYYGLFKEGFYVIWQPNISTITSFICLSRKVAVFGRLLSCKYFTSFKGMISYRSTYS